MKKIIAFCMMLIGLLGLWGGRFGVVLSEPFISLSLILFCAGLVTAVTVD